MPDVLISGCGLIGTSIGLALRGSGRSVELHDVDPVHLDVAVGRGAGHAWTGEPAKLVVVAVPPGATVEALLGLQRRNLALTYTHVASVQSHVQAEIEAHSPDPSVVVGSHPMAGREVAGPRAAVQDLFVGRPWAVCEWPGASSAAVHAVIQLAEACGATPVVVRTELHDRAVALLSHLPQVASSGLASLLSTAGVALDDVAMALVGPGLVDTTRLAAADSRLWTEILTLNARHVAPPLRLLIAELSALADALEGAADAPDEAARTVAGFLGRGNVGRGSIPVKRGATSDAFSVLRVELADEPGALARLLVAVEELGVNVEDVRLEHVPGRPRGVAELLVGERSADLAQPLVDAGWVVLNS